jgi:2-C-methyl-D-erythritol 4-phosphate cytidylyltransferase
MNIALITAAGVGARTKMCIPKQFISVNDKPIIIYTLEKFQKNENIDEIVVVCLDGWQKYLEACAKQFGISKLFSIVTGGSTGQESIQNGIYSLKNHLKENDIVLVHDGIRPGIDDEIINNCIKQVKTDGSSITKVPTTEVIFDIEKSLNYPILVNRDNIFRTQTPQGLFYGDAFKLYKMAEKDKIALIAPCSLLSHYKRPLYFIDGSSLNFKITTKDDIDLFKGLIKVNL